MKNNPAVIARKLHKWLGLLVGLQVLIWLLSGLYMVIMDLDFIHGDTLVRNTQQEIQVPGNQEVRMSEVLDRFPAATDIGLTVVMGKTFYRVTSEGQRYLLDPGNGDIVSPLDEETARQIAGFHYDGKAEIAAAKLIETNPPMEIQTRRLPLWRIDFDDDYATSFYIDPHDGSLATRRFSFWRIFDFMWMLHIMDYDERQDAHHPLLISAQATGLVFVLAGVILLFYSFHRRRSTRIQALPLIKRWHKWLALLVGLQIILWLTSGLVISLLDPAKVSGRLWSASSPGQTTPLSSRSRLEPSDLPLEYLQNATQLELTSMHGAAVYRVVNNRGETLLDANNGTAMLFNGEQARKIAEKDFLGDGKSVSVEAGMAPDIETRGHSGPYWRVSFPDNVNTTIYVSTQTGEILERRNTYWRVRDFFWMLHTMDYVSRDNFNNRLITTVILVAVWIGVSGLILLFGSFSRHEFAFLNPLAKRRLACVTLKDPANGLSRQVQLKAGNNLFLELAANGVELPSVCGGGGECGKCRVRFEGHDLREANEVEKGLIPAPLRKQGFRLACQVQARDGLTLVLPSQGSSDQGKP
jgi:Na+-transporting NADH:ubiquinone oxidoreductase subunit F